MNRLRHLFARRRIDTELAEEIRGHIEERAEELIAEGMNPDDALHAARAQFGNPTFLLEESREVWSIMAIDNLIRDLRLGARALRKSPLFTAVAVLTLALGIGANTAIFSLIDAVMLRPLPFPDANRIVMLWEVPPKRIQAASPGNDPTQNTVSPVNFLDWRARTHSFTAMSAMEPFPMGLSGYGEPRAVDGLRVSADYFRVLGVAPLLGRTFTAAEDVPNGPPVVVLSYSLWQEQFGGDRTVIGRHIQISDAPCTIIGVMPQGFDLPFRHAEVWAPIQIQPGGGDEGRYLNVIAKLKPGVTMAEAQADMNNAARQIAQLRPFLSRDWTTNVLSIYDQTTGKVRPALLVLFGAVTLVLLIAAGNVGNLLLMRGAGRQREIAVRVALGAGRARIAGQLLAESLLLSLAGSAAGVGLAYAGLRAIVASLPALALPRTEGLHVDARVLGFSLVLCMITTLLFGLAPALSFSRANPDDALKSGLRNTSRGAHRTRALLVMTEVALSMVLLVGAGLMVRSFVRQTGVERGFRTDRILTMRMFFATAGYSDNGRRARYLEDVLTRVRALPGVEAASTAHFLPMTGIVPGSCFTRADRPEPAEGFAPTADFMTVSSGYFAVMRTPFLAGRDFNDHDRFGDDAALIVNQAFARRFFPNEDPVGHQLHLCWNARHGTIVGVSANTRQTDLKVAPNPTIFLDQVQVPMYFAALVVRTAVPPMTMARGVQEAVHAVDPDQAISDVETMDDVVAESVARPRLESMLLGVFAGIALVLAVVGLYGVLAYAVTQQTREIGIRMALGADSGRLRREVLTRGLRLIVIGMAGGLALAVGPTRYVESMLYEVKPTDPLTFAAVAAALLIAGVLASWLPARRATAVDPVLSLRWE